MLRRLAVAAGFTFALAQDKVWQRVLMTQDAQQNGAVCLDGSPGAYYVKWGSGADVNKWIVHINGGGWCTDPKDCFGRSLTSLGSSSSYAPTADFGGFDMLNITIERNPDFYQYTSVFVMYCDGASLAGNADQPTVYNGTQLWFRGYRILQAVFNNLLAANPQPGGGPSLSDATNIILTGNSAGGLATYLHADTVASWLPKTADFRAIPEVGFFLDAESVDGTNGYTPMYQNVAAMQNITTGAFEQVNPACMAALPPDSRWQCFMAEFTYPFIKTPIFIQNSKLDNWQLRNILAADVPSCTPQSCELHADTGMVNCASAPATNCTPTEFIAFQGYAVQFMSALSQSLASNVNAFNGVNGGLITSCDLHDHMIGGGWNKIMVGGKSMREIVTPWMQGKAPGTWTFDVDWPNNPTCNGPL